MAIPFTVKMSDDRVLRCDLFPAPGEARGLLVISHGFKGFKDWGMFPYAAERIAVQTGIDVITYNFSHNGVGEEPMDFTELDKFAHNTYSRQLEDVEALIHTVYAEHFPKPLTTPLFLLGHSWGAGVSLLYALEHPKDVCGVISWNGVAHPDIFSAQEKEEMRTNGVAYTLNGRTKQNMPLNAEILHDLELNAERYHIVNRIQNADFAITLIQGSEDFDRLRRGSETLVQSNPAIQWVQIPAGNHTFGAVHPFQGTTEPLEAAVEQTCAFILGHLPQSQTGTQGEIE